jgi:MoaA/NifB/PqqE/SkfB family radical SAM enzyme
MPVQAAQKLIQEFVAQGGEDVTITGGEPLTHPGLLDLLKAAKLANLSTTIFSMGISEDGTPIKRNQALEIAPYIDEWWVSFHSSTSNVHDLITRYPSSFSATVAAVRTLSSAGISVHATFVARPETICELGAVASMCANFGIGELRVITVIEQGRASNRSGMSAVRSEEVLREISLAKFKAGIEVRLGESSKAEFGLANNCQAIQKELIVDCNGWVSACHIVEPRRSADQNDNVFKVPLADVIAESSRLAACRKRLLDGQFGCANGCIVRQAMDVIFRREIIVS